jgi:SAM-dependent methyltransferase
MGSIDRNQRTYGARDVVFFFARRKELQPPEAAVAELLQEELGQMRMLDLGVGGGRTAHHFLPRVASYVAIDYSARMIEACRQHFPGRAEAFQVGDARKLEHFGDGNFDFVLFSYNGIDCMDHPDRLRTLREMKRLLAPDGWLCFSSHNASSLPIDRWRFGSLMVTLRLRWLNDAETLRRARTADWFVIRDLPRIRNYYIRPQAQLAQLEAAGLPGAQVFGLDGRELQGDELAAAKDPWLYYLCRLPARAESAVSPGAPIARRV